MKKIKKYPSQHTHTLDLKETRIRRLTSVTLFGREYCFFFYIKNALRRLKLFVEIIQ